MKAHFFRLLDVPVNEKEVVLRRLTGDSPHKHRDRRFSVDPFSFRRVPRTPFAYWVSDNIRELFDKLPSFEGDGRTVKQGLATADDNRFVRTWWEVPPEQILDAENGPDWRTDLESLQEWCYRRTYEGKKWTPFAKGGEFSQYYADIHLVVNWEQDGKEIRNYSDPNSGRPYSRPQNTKFYFLPGLTWSDRTTRMFSARAWSAGGIFSVKGSAGFFNGDELLVLGLMNSLVFNGFLALLVGAGDVAARSYQVGTIGSVPFPMIGDHPYQANINILVRSAIDIKRESDLIDESSRIFQFPCLLMVKGYSIFERIRTWQDHVTKTQFELREISLKIDTLGWQIYKINDRDRHGIEKGLGIYHDMKGMLETESLDNDVEGWRESVDPRMLTSDVISFAIGIILGRWDIRFVLDHSLLPGLQDPFDPLPICPPGSLIGADGLPARPGSIGSKAWLCARPNAITLPKGFRGLATIPDDEYPLPIAWDGVLVDDHAHTRDLVFAVRKVLKLIWGDQSDAIEDEACEILEITSLREYFLDPRKGFFTFHIKRYSKSRRKAPIYWLLQSQNRNYGVWLYYHRLTADTLFHIAREYVDPKVNLEENRLQEMQAELESLSGAARKARERDAAEQMSLVEELKAFKKDIDAAAMLELKPDLNDGVLLNIAPLHKLVPWKEAQKTWAELMEGKYEWSSIGKQLRVKGIVKGK